MSSNNQDKRPEGPKKRRLLFSSLLWAVILVLMFNFFFAKMNKQQTEEISYTAFIALLQGDTVESVLREANRYVITLAPAEGAVSTEVTTTAPKGGILDGLRVDPKPKMLVSSVVTAQVEADELIPLMQEKGVDFKVKMVEEQSFLFNLILTYLLPTLLLIGLFFFLMRRMGGGMGGMGGVGKANAKVYVERSTGVSFNDVAGQDEAKESLQEIIDFLHSPKKYTEIGAKLPKGALLVGSPGTGKTLMAKAVAGEAGVPFFSISGSDFVEMFVGVGASRVRDLFKEASKLAPCIIFIDEIDTIGKSRDNRMGGNDEREQTLNQLLAELDGFDPTKGVIVLAATNRPEVLDKALLRPGRFDRRITVDRPNLAGRLATLQVHTRKIRLSDDVDLQKLAQATAGCVGADLANLVNEAALRAVRMGRHAVNQRDLLSSFEMVIAGAEKKGTVLNEQEKKLIAYHEVGHALVAALEKDSEPVTKITIVPHTQGALGFTMQTPEEERFLLDSEELHGRIRILLAGRCAEELVFNTRTTGAANDIERATDLARKMVTMYGMSERFGMMALATIQNQYLDGAMGLTCAEATAADIDLEIRKIIDTCHDAAYAILAENREKLDEVTAYLLKRETITGGELMSILDGRDPEEEALPVEETIIREWIPPRLRKPEPAGDAPTTEHGGTVPPDYTSASSDANKPEPSASNIDIPDIF